ncbi:Regulator of chromosome condensation 1/beta-lactamase-inhibitor protein II [Phytophthora cactorum]|nr:Regulator of chromosome condensation 1/beta-lactamase-inhibitor protein II [Phytophthora cactorum]
MYMSYVACGEYHSLALSSDGRVFRGVAVHMGNLVTKQWENDMLSVALQQGRPFSCHQQRRRSIYMGTWRLWPARPWMLHGRSEPKQVMAISAAISEKCGLIDIAGGNDFSIFLLQTAPLICGRDPSLDIEKLHLSPSLLTLPSTSR